MINSLLTPPIIDTFLLKVLKIYSGKINHKKFTSYFNITSNVNKSAIFIYS